MSHVSNRNAAWAFFRGQEEDPDCEPFQAVKRRLDPCRFVHRGSSTKGSGPRGLRAIERWFDASRFCRRCGLMFTPRAGESETLCREHARVPDLWPKS